jgi:hypothetical protein
MASHTDYLRLERDVVCYTNISRDNFLGEQLRINNVIFYRLV